MKEAFYNRLKKNSAHRLKWAKREGLGAYRLYHQDIPEFPFIIDRYNEYIIVWNRLKEGLDQNIIEDLPQIQSDLRELFELPSGADDKLVWKERMVQTREQRYQKYSEDQKHIVVHEQGRKYYCNLWDYLDTGLFLDMRTQRARIQHKLKPQSVLNLFSYTCSVGVSAALGGAITTNIDMSKTYLDWGMDNYKLNGIDLGVHRFIQGPCHEVLAEVPTKKFELIFLDPPTFSNSKRMEMDFDVQENHSELIRLALKWLTPNGVMLFSTNKKKFKLAEDLLSEFKIQETTGLTIPEDFKNSAIHKSFEIRKK